MANKMFISGKKLQGVPKNLVIKKIIVEYIFNIKINAKVY